MHFEGEVGDWGMEGSQLKIEIEGTLADYWEDEKKKRIERGLESD